MTTSHPERRTLQFGAFEVNLVTREIRKCGVRIRLQAQPFQVLAMLLGRPGDVVTREELQNQLWPEEAFGEFDQGLNTAVKKIRQALGDSADTPRYIETLPRIGYRFVYPLEGGPKTQQREATAKPPGETANPFQRLGPFTGRITPLPAAVGVLLIAVLSSAVVYFWPGGDSGQVISGSALNPVPLTSHLGIEQTPSFSPDGDQIAFSWNGGSEANIDIYVKRIDRVTPVRRTTHPAPDLSPAWSPDGRSIAFVRRRHGGPAAVILIDAIGGPERILAEGDFPVHETFYWQSGPALAWFPGSKWLTIAQGSEPSDTAALFLLSVETGELRRLTSPPEFSGGDGAPAVSPDGRTLAFFRDASWADRDLYLLSLSKDHTPIGSPRRRTSLNSWVHSPAWTPDGRDIVFGARDGLWRVPAFGSGEPQRMALAGEDAWQPAISSEGLRLAYARRSSDSNIWRLELPAPTDNVTAATATPIPLVASTRTEAGPAYSPDGTRLAYSSNISGDYGILVSDADGSNALELFSPKGAACGSVQWAPDSRRLVFDSNMEGQFEVYMISANGGRPTRLTTNPAMDVHPSWSHDGKWVYFSSGRNGEHRIFKMQVGEDGPLGPPVQVTNNASMWAFESPDGSLYYQYSNGDEGGVLLANLSKRAPCGGEETEILRRLIRRNFAVTGHGVYFMALPDVPDGTQLVQFLNPNTGKIRTLSRISGDRVNTGMSVSPDGRHLLYVQRDVTGSDLMLVENFQ